jgi:hypothetical protein
MAMALLQQAMNGRFIGAKYAAAGRYSQMIISQR